VVTGPANYLKSLDVAHRKGESFDAFGEDVGEVVGAFDGAADDQGGGVARGAAVAGPDGYRADDVDEAAFVFEGEEGDAAGAAGSLAVAGDIRVGWDNHLEFARENPNLYKLMWAPGASVNGAAGEAFRILYERPELGASKGQLRVSVETAARMILPAVTGSALAAIYRPELFSDPTYATQLREAVIAAVTAPADKPTGKRASGDAGAPTIATAAATLKTQLAVEHTALTAPERALMDQWLTTLADAPTAASATPTATHNQGALDMATTAAELTTYRWSFTDDADRFAVEDPATGEVITIVQSGGTDGGQRGTTHFRLPPRRHDRDDAGVPIDEDRPRPPRVEHRRY
jgi:hypothetical protein